MGLGSRLVLSVGICERMNKKSLSCISGPNSHNQIDLGLPKKGLCPLLESLQWLIRGLMLMNILFGSSEDRGRAVPGTTWILLALC